MAYSPIEHAPGEQKGMLNNPQLELIALQHGATPAQIALAWLLQQGVVVIPKASKQVHVEENRAALDIKLTSDDLAELDRAFPTPHKKVPLQVK